MPTEREVASYEAEILRLKQKLAKKQVKYVDPQRDYLRKQRDYERMKLETALLSVARVVGLHRSVSVITDAITNDDMDDMACPEEDPHAD